MFNFFSKNKSQGLTDEELKLKAGGVCFSIMILSEEITKEMLKRIKYFEKLDSSSKNKLSFVISYFTLFNAQKNFWERVIKNEEEAKVFEHFLYLFFEKAVNFNPTSLIKEIVDYVGNEPSREVQYIGSAICKQLDKKDAFLMLEISTVYSSFLLHGFYDSLMKGWSLPKEKLQEISEGLNKLKE
ncbi:hypothetical protein A3F03_01450 [Candidatus Roizmanbacteria bacterium RIFCSPHIGHO2_12_FULL_41_11]|uniref:Uncharacterized protein n=3 Tax=Candidatus Roizmaniibacteriota TaxID=1752723 RepID=A0A1F7JR67_9BACT|nr:MAG: hypothetical protein A3F03_01450 [Candidatus Roizmanbacteria bacterium RIFCSPHIGHO2_12_FULL_41_11]OGK51512.1 MAG: hypothetical protein A2966_01505 [Candidatus Roizmanbacteria bacterium RIFCSPLOWO2_01_FULL_41_22]OGK58110.1 MAG: hypothetical protein A3H86_01295 [Candidatus Roizmanbacteria bacterium RIFCSPLOWO2_02_FULL_41_9]